MDGTGRSCVMNSRGRRDHAGQRSVVVAGVPGFWLVVRARCGRRRRHGPHFERLADDHPDCCLVLAAAGDD